MNQKAHETYHALDLYTILATTTEKEWKYALELRVQYGNEQYVMEASCRRTSLILRGNPDL